MLHLVMLSGGSDSVGLLFKLLKENPAQDVHAHHVTLKDPAGRSAMESKAVNDVMAYCRKHYGPVGFTSSDYVYQNQSWLFDYPIVGFHAGQVTRDLCQQRNGADIQVYIAEQANDNHGEIAARRKIQQGTFDIQFQDWREAGLPVPVMVYPCRDITKAELASYIPEALEQSVWSCRYPQHAGSHIIPCGKCGPCIELFKSKESK